MSFNLGELIAEGKVPKLDTNDRREQIEYIHIDKIDDDPNNFYELSALEELAENIELIGLQQPLRVRPSPEDPTRVILVSGHRRRAAIRMLVAGGREDLAEIPCIREQGEGSAALRELRLIYANSDTRKMKPADVDRQAERVEALLYQLKEEGYDFPGRMRDHVAEACKVSKSKLARLKVIRENLHQELRPAWDSGRMNETVAYRWAQEPVDGQSRLLALLKLEKTAPAELREYSVDSRFKKIKTISDRPCTACGTPCPHASVMLEYVFSKPNQYHYCEYYCCATCPNMSSCGKVCPEMADTAKAAKEKARLAKRQEAAEEAARRAPKVAAVRDIWQRFDIARLSAGKTVKECFEAAKCYYAASDDQRCEEIVNGTAKIDPDSTYLPFGYIHLSAVESVVGVADLLNVSTDYLLGRTSDPRRMDVIAGGGPQPPAEGWLPLEWIPGEEKPQKPMLAAAQFDLGKEQAYTTIVQWDGVGWCFKNNGAHLESRCLRWFPLPEEENHG